VLSPATADWDDSSRHGVSAKTYSNLTIWGAALQLAGSSTLQVAAALNAIRKWGPLVGAITAQTSLTQTEADGAWWPDQQQGAQIALFESSTKTCIVHACTNAAPQGEGKTARQMLSY